MIQYCVASAAENLDAGGADVLVAKELPTPANHKSAMSVDNIAVMGSAVIQRQLAQTTREVMADARAGPGQIRFSSLLDYVSVCRGLRDLFGRGQGRAFNIDACRVRNLAGCPKVMCPSSTGLVVYSPAFPV